MERTMLTLMIAIYSSDHQEHRKRRHHRLHRFHRGRPASHLVLPFKRGGMPLWHRVSRQPAPQLRGRRSGCHRHHQRCGQEVFLERQGGRQRDDAVQHSRRHRGRCLGYLLGGQSLSVLLLAHLLIRHHIMCDVVFYICFLCKS